MNIAQEFLKKVQVVLQSNVSEKDKMDQIWDIGENYAILITFKERSITFFDDSKLVFGKNIAHMFLRLDKDDYSKELV